MTGVDWGEARPARGHIYLQMQLCVVTLGTFQKLLEKLAFFNNGHTIVCFSRILHR